MKSEPWSVEVTKYFVFFLKGCAKTEKDSAANDDDSLMTPLRERRRRRMGMVWEDINYERRKKEEGRSWRQSAQI